MGPGVYQDIIEGRDALNPGPDELNGIVIITRWDAMLKDRTDAVKCDLSRTFSKDGPADHYAMGGGGMAFFRESAV